MAHKIDHSKGKPAFITFQQPAWHNLGKIFVKDITVENALHEAGLDFEVLKTANKHQIPGSDILITSDSSFFTWRKDTEAILGTRLGIDYTVYQNTEALSVVDEMLKFGKCKIETAGAVDGGRRVFILLKIESPMKISKDDIIYHYVLLANSHDGSMSIIAMPTNVRVVCWNTLTAAIGGAKGIHKIRHTKNAQDRVKEAISIMGMADESFKLNTAAFKAMREHTITEQKFFDYIGNIFMTPEEIKKLQKGDKQDVLSTRKKNILAEVFKFSEEGVGQKEAKSDKGLNYWYAYNAVTGYLTSKKYGSADDRFNSLLFGNSAQQIKASAELALHPDRIETLSRVNKLSNLILN